MKRVKLDMEVDFYDGLDRYSVDLNSAGKFSLSEEEYNDLVEVGKRFAAWQVKLRDIQPDDYVAPPPPTKEQLAARAEASRIDAMPDSDFIAMLDALDAA